MADDAIEKPEEWDFAWDPRRPTLTLAQLDALRVAASLPFRSVSVPTDVLLALLNAREDWHDVARKLQGALRDERERSAELDARNRELARELVLAEGG